MIQAQDYDIDVFKDKVKQIAAQLQEQPAVED